MSDPRRHHYIPKFYLSRWANSAGLVSTYSRPGGKLYVHDYAPKQIGAEMGLYALDGVPQEMRNLIERDFMGPEIDDPAAHALAILLNEIAGPLTPALRLSWVRFLVSLMIRTPGRLAELKADSAKILRDALSAKPEEYEAARGPDDPPTFLEFVEAKGLEWIFDNFGTSMLPQLVDIPHMNADIGRMDWRVLHFVGGPYGILTSDFPICMLPGLADPACLISLPLSPTAIFLAANNRATLDAIEGQEASKVIDAVNALSIRSARSHVYGDSQQYGPLVDHWLAD